MQQCCHFVWSTKAKMCFSKTSKFAENISSKTLNAISKRCDPSPSSAIPHGPTVLQINCLAVKRRQVQRSQYPALPPRVRCGLRGDARPHRGPLVLTGNVAWCPRKGRSPNYLTGSARSSLDNVSRSSLKSVNKSSQSKFTLVIFFEGNMIFFRTS